jgi:ABC-2 type transport system ATP-binding protein
MTIESPDEHRAWIYLGVTQGAATPIFLVNPGREHLLKPGTTEVKMQIPSLPLPAGRYYLWGGIYKNWTNGVPLIDWQPMVRFDTYGPQLDAAPTAVVRLSPLHVETEWEFADR